MVMEIDWDLYKRAEDEMRFLKEEFKKRFFSSNEDEKENYFHEIEADATFTTSGLKIQTPYNTYIFNKKLDGTFIFKKDKIEQYVYDIDGKYSFENWKKLLSEAEEDFAQVLGISEDVLRWLDTNTKRTMTQSVSKLFSSIFGKKEQPASIEYKEELDTQDKADKKEEDFEEKVAKTKEKTPKEEDEKSKQG